MPSPREKKPCITSRDLLWLLLGFSTGLYTYVMLSTDLSFLDTSAIHEIQKSWQEQGTAKSIKSTIEAEKPGGEEQAMEAEEEENEEADDGTAPDKTKGALAPYPHLDEYLKSPLREPRPRPTHGCKYHNGNSYCRMQKLQVHVSKIHAKAAGGEALHTVMGQREEDEFLKYSPGAFTVPRPLESQLQTNLRKVLHTKEVMKALQVAPSTCHTSTDRLTFFMARYDYVHIYFMLLALMNAFWELPEDDMFSPVDVVFLDAHPEGSIDIIWHKLFGGNVTHARRLSTDNLVCYNNAIILSDEYNSLTRQDGQRQVTRVTPSPVMMDAFVHFVLQRYQLADVQMEPGRITMFERVPYIAHPRSDLNKKRRIVKNMPEIKEHLMRIDGVTSVHVLRLETMTFGEQVEAIRKSNVILANHGAALTHLVWLADGASALEMKTENNVFQLLSRWKPNVFYQDLPQLPSKAETSIPTSYLDAHIVPAVKRAVQREVTVG